MIIEGDRLSAEREKLASRRAAQARDTARSTMSLGLTGNAGATTPRSAIPILRCHELARTINFYGLLGFRAVTMPGYAVLHAGNVELHVSETTDYVPGGCLIHVGDVRAVWHELNGHGLAALGSIEQEFGQIGFTVLDPDENQVRITGPMP
ncbi:hypothetical protein [Actinoplanes sp. NPDC051851]|uniref:hypothetical protein n=1 Tax=Actinoplanes sp. NPDC051851 TaxID=3154753 RepID=UPI00344581EA